MQETSDERITWTQRDMKREAFRYVNRPLRKERRDQLYLRLYRNGQNSSVKAAIDGLEIKRDLALRHLHAMWIA
jgi:hypothetical protein